MLESPLRLAIDTIPGLVWTALPNGDIDFLNRRWLDYTGLPAADACGWGWQIAIHPDDRPALITYWKSILTSGEPGEAQARLRGADEHYRWFLFRAMPLHDDAGRVIKWYGQTTDIDERVRAESLLASEKRILEKIARGAALREVLESICNLVDESMEGALCAIVLLDEKRERLVHAAGPLLPEAFNQSVHGRPVNTQSGPCAMAATLREQVIAADIGMDFRWEGYAWRTVALSHGLRACWSTPILSLSGESLGSFAIYHRTPAVPTERDQALIAQITHIASIAIENTRKDQELRRSRRYLAEAQRLSLTGSFSWRPDEHEVFWSEETYRIYGVPADVRPTLDLMIERMHPDDRAGFVAKTSYARTALRDLELEYRLQMPDGSIKHVQLFARAVSDQEGRQTELVGAVRDLTQLRRAEDVLHTVRSELAHVSRVTTLGEMSASIAHEVHQPLLGILTNATTAVRMLDHDPPNIELARRTAQRTIRDANRAIDVIKQLRELFRKHKPVFKAIDLNRAVREIAALMRPALERSEVILKLNLGDEVPAVLADRVQLQQVVLNLMMNAMEAMAGDQGEPRELVVHTRANGLYVRFEVRDRGPGIDPSLGDRIFEPFHTTKANGMGVGLSVSRSIIENHGGRLWAEPNEGGGAKFIFEVPHSAQPESGEAAGTAQMKQESLDES